jgi:phosphate transport system protein
VPSANITSPETVAMPESRHALVVKKKQIEKNLIDLFTAVADAMDQAMSCLASENKAICHAIIEQDAEINRSRHLVERECLTAIALHQLVAHDLRDMVAATRIAADLERIGDYAADIASISLQMTDTDLAEIGISALLRMSSLCSNMMAAVLSAYRDKDTERAKAAARIDDDVDTEHAKLVQMLFSKMQSTPALVPDASRMIWISHLLERYGDHLTNIAEQVLFAIEGKVVELD